MLQTLRNLWNPSRLKKFTDTRNIGLYVFVMITIAITWSGVKAVQKNYDLQKKIASLRQENEVLQLQNENTKLQNKYLETDQYLELAARQNFGLAAPGEKILLVPKNVAMRYVDKSLTTKTKIQKISHDDSPQYIKNLEDWRDFLSGRKLFDD